MNLPRIMIAATSSGSGKTLITCGLLTALKRKNLRLSSFKCGPDYIDPMFHKTVLEIPSRNLDSFFSDENRIKRVLTRGGKDAEMAVIEGVMGYYDGAGFGSTKASSYDIARLTKTPVILVLNARGMSLSAVASIKGFIEFQSDSNICGVILNQISKMVYQGLKPVIEEMLGLPVCGYLPKLEDCYIESRHLGLVTPGEIDDIHDKLDQVADVMEETINLDQILEIAKKAPNLADESFWEFRKEKNSKIKVAIARDEAFCFYYEDNLDLLCDSGIELILFSPIRDEKIPDDVSGLILGGGYPELHAKELSNNKSMLSSVKKAIEKGLPCIAECGGFLYLHDQIEDINHNKYPMAGVISGEGIYTGKLGRFGYIDVELKHNQMFGEKGMTCRGHEFHYYDSTNNGNSVTARKPMRNRNWECMHGTQRLEAGFPHLYYESNPSFSEGFIRQCKEYMKDNDSYLS